MGGMMPEGKLRIIAGAYKGRAIRFPDVPDLRPSPARLRETLFHWLREDLMISAVVLDAFAGSGALGFEALSAGAQSVTMIERHAKAVAGLHQSALQLGVPDDRLLIIKKSMPVACRSLPKQHFNVVFLDPPFASDLYVRSLQALIESGVLCYPVYVYTERSVHRPELDWSGALTSLHQMTSCKQARAGDVLGNLWLLTLDAS
jgi:16S rRNA (guanine966-N2)-methyltransferase